MTRAVKDRIESKSKQQSWIRVGVPLVRKTASLHELASLGSREELAKRLPKASSEEVNKHDDSGQTLLHQAIESEQEDIIELIVSHRSVRASVRDRQRRTALHLAVRTGNLRLVELVLQICSEVDLRGPSERTPLHEATSNSVVAIARLLIKHGANLLIPDKDSVTPIGIAASRGSIPVLEVLLSSNSYYTTADMLQSRSGTEHSSLLHLAVESGSAEAVVYLLHKGIDQRSIDIRGFTALHIACCRGVLPVVRLLIDSDSWLIDAASFDGVTPLHVAAKHDQLLVVDYLLSKGASLDALTSTGASPLFFAASNGAHTTVKEILTRKVNYLAKDEDGVNVLHCTVGHAKTLRTLIEGLKNRPGFYELISASDISGATPLHYASQYGNTSDVVLLVEHGARLDLVMQGGITPLHLAAGRGHLAIVKRLSSYSPRLINAVDDCGRTPLHIASLYGYPKVVEHLLLNGATLVTDRDGRNAFYCAAWKGSVECLKILLSAFCSGLDCKDNEKATPLHLAASANHPEVVAFLLDHGASITLNEAGQNCLDIAIARDFEECASVIVNHERWKESMKPLSSAQATSQLQDLVQKMPDQAMTIMDKCIVSSKEDGKVKQTYQFNYMLGVTDEKSPINLHASRRLLEAMVQLNRQSCLTHPICVEFLNVMWEKFLAVVVILNITIYGAFLISLVMMVINFPVYSPHPLRHEGSIKRLMHAIRLAREDNRTTLNSNEKFDFCYGNEVFRHAVLIAAVTCLIKEMIPMWFKGLGYFTRLVNWCELVVYAMTLFFLDPFGFFHDSLDIPRTSCPKLVWEVVALTVFLAWIVLLMNFQKLPHVGVYIVMMMSIIKTMLQVVIVASLFVLGFALAFYMLMSHMQEAIFASSGLSLMRITAMIAGDLAYEDILPPTPVLENHDLSVYYDQLRNEYGKFNFTDLLPMKETNSSHVGVSAANISYVSLQCSDDDTGADTNLFAPQLSYIFFVCFALLMPIVVLNVLIGLAVGDIEAVRADASLRQIRMQVKLLVEVEAVLPCWFINRIDVINSSHFPEEEDNWRGLVRRAMRAAEQPTGKEKSLFADQLAEANRNVQETREWLGNIEASLQQQLALIRTLAACVKKQQLQNVSVNDNLDEEVAFQEEKAEIELEAEREAEREAEQEVTSTEQLDGDDVV